MVFPLQQAIETFKSTTIDLQEHEVRKDEVDVATLAPLSGYADWSSESSVSAGPYNESGIPYAFFHLHYTWKRLRYKMAIVNVDKFIDSEGWVISRKVSTFQRRRWNGHLSHLRLRCWLLLLRPLRSLTLRRYSSFSGQPRVSPLPSLPRQSATRSKK